MKSKVFVKAAEYLEKHRTGACLAICWSQYKEYNSDDINIKKFTELFQPETAPLVWYGKITNDNQLARQLGLLLCAEVLKDEQKAKRKKK